MSAFEQVHYKRNINQLMEHDRKRKRNWKRKKKQKKEKKPKKWIAEIW